MKVRDLKFIEDPESPHWLGIVEDPPLICRIYIVADEDGPTERQKKKLENFIERKKSLFSEIIRKVLNENKNKKVVKNTFHLDALFVHGENENFEIDLAGSVKEKKFFGYAKIPWNVSITTDTFRLK